MTAKIRIAFLILALIPTQRGQGVQSSSVERATSAKSESNIPPVKKKGTAIDNRAQAIDKLIQQISASGRVLESGEKCSERLTPPARIAPGIPPLLSFRYFQGADRMRFGKLDLVVDDAGH
jgi:hypothetical protein